MENKNNIKRKKKVKIESKQPTYLTYGKNHPKVKTKKNLIQAHKIVNKEHDEKKKATNEIKEEKSKTEIKKIRIVPEIKIEKKEYIPYSCIPCLEEPEKDLTYKNEAIQK
jgi:hypothetical protein